MTRPKPLQVPRWPAVSPARSAAPPAGPRGAAWQIGRFARATVATLVRWSRRSLERGRLGELPDYLLRDIGVSREQAAHEVAKPFWKL